MKPRAKNEKRREHVVEKYNLTSHHSETLSVRGGLAGDSVHSRENRQYMKNRTGCYHTGFLLTTMFKDFAQFLGWFAGLSYE